MGFEICNILETQEFTKLELVAKMLNKRIQLKRYI